MKALISGYGRMGHMIEQVLAERGIPCAGWSEDIASVPAEQARECVCIDFTTPDAFRKNYGVIAERFGAAVIGTTGWYDIREEVFSAFRRCGTPMVWASNYSVGVNVLTAAVRQTARLLAKAGGYTPYLVEKHHCHKLDAPSGTALTLKEAVEEYMPVPGAICSVRAGEIPGIHSVTFEGLNDRITLEHEAFSRRGLAEGAVLAATLVVGTEGVHEFKELFFQ